MISGKNFNTHTHTHTHTHRRSFSFSCFSQSSQLGHQRRAEYNPRVRSTNTCRQRLAESVFPPAQADGARPHHVPRSHARLGQVAQPRQRHLAEVMCLFLFGFFFFVWFVCLFVCFSFPLHELCPQHSNL